MQTDCVLLWQKRRTDMNTSCRSKWARLGLHTDQIRSICGNSRCNNMPCNPIGQPSVRWRYQLAVPLTLEGITHLFLHGVYRERDAAVAASQQSLSSQLLHDPPHAYTAHLSHVTVTLDDLLSAAQAAVNRQAGTAAISTITRKQGSHSQQQRLQGPGSCVVGSDASWVVGTMMKLKELLLESDRYCAPWLYSCWMSSYQLVTRTNGHISGPGPGSSCYAVDTAGRNKAVSCILQQPVNTIETT